MAPKRVPMSEESESVVARAALRRDTPNTGCYWCARYAIHEPNCPTRQYVLMRPGECWEINGHHFKVEYIEDDGIVVGFLSFSTYRTRFTRVQLNAYVVRPRRIAECHLCRR